jgi:hypothetical protein
LFDSKQKDAKANKGNRLALIVKTKSFAEVAAAFEPIWRRAARRTRRKEKGTDVPREFSTDSRAKFR